MATLKTPIICTVIGEGGSGGALAIGVGDRVFMLGYSVYSVISPEGCASILWKSAEKAETAADALGLTADKLMQQNLIDGVIKEPLGGAHRNPEAMAQSIKDNLMDALLDVEQMDIATMVAQRIERLAAIGPYSG
jgi:acetyl-CoA carboxylase carboxyl transferase subunit alpha